MADGLGQTVQLTLFFGGIVVVAVDMFMLMILLMFVIVFLLFGVLFLSQRSALKRLNGGD